MADLLGRPVEVASLGIDLLADAVEQQGVPVERVDWRPPAAPLPTLPGAAAANTRASTSRIQSRRSSTSASLAP